MGLDGRGGFFLLPTIYLTTYKSSHFRGGFLTRGGQDLVNVKAGCVYGKTEVLFFRRVRYEELG